METALFILFCLAVAVCGAYEVSKHKPPIGRLPEDIQ